MVAINYATREVTCKIVFYGPGLSGKTTNLQYVHEKVPANTKGKMISLATEADRTLYFDFLPINIGSISGFDAKFQLYTVPGQVYYNATRKLVLRGADGLVFVADSQADKMDENIESINNMKENLEEYGYDINDMPIVIQYNKRDLPNILSVEELNTKLNEIGWPSFEACAVSGTGVFDTLKLIIKLVLDKAQKTQSKPSRPKPEPEKVPAAVAAEGTPPVSEADAVSQVPPTESPKQVRENAYDSDGAPISDDTTRSPGETMYEHSVLSDETNGAHSAPAADSPTVDAKPVVSSPADDTSPVSTNDTDEKPEGAVDWGADERPFPGSTGKAKTAGRRISVSDFQSPAKNQTGEDQVVNETGDGAASEGLDSDLPTPRMEPSNRVKKKKRGFFKRLFGVK